MRLWALIVLFAAGAVPAEMSSLYIGGVTFSAAEIRKNGSVYRLRGNVEIWTDAMMLRTDEADFHRDTGEIEPRGNVRVRLLQKPAPSQEAPPRPTLDQLRRAPDILKWHPEIFLKK
jgi:hypothetical protein